MNALSTYWSRLSAREHRVLVAGVVALALIIGWFGVWEPLTKGVAERRVQVQEQQALKQWMQQAAAQLQQQRGASGSALVAIVDRSAHQAGFGATLKRVETAADSASGGVQVWFERVSFDELMAWLLQLRRNERIKVTTLTVERLDSPGLVNAALTLHGAQ